MVMNIGMGMRLKAWRLGGNESGIAVVNTSEVALGRQTIY